jgi:hypothetical protein
MSLFAELNTQRERADGLKKRLAWAFVVEADAEVARLEARSAEARDKLPKIDNKLAKTEAALEEAQADKTEKSRAVAEFTAAFAATGEERKAALAAAAKARKAEEEAKRALSETQRTREEIRRKAARTTTALHSARETQQRETQADTRAADAAIARANERLEAAQAASERARAEERAAAAAAAEARAARDAGAKEEEDTVHEEREARDAVARLQGAQRNGLTMFGNQMPDLVRGARPAIRRAPEPCMPRCACTAPRPASMHRARACSSHACRLTLPCARLCAVTSASHTPLLCLASLPQQLCKPTAGASPRRPWAPLARCCACLIPSGLLRLRRPSATRCPTSWWPTPRTGACCRTWPRVWAS